MGNTIPYGAWMADAEGRNIYISPLFLELVGMTFEQVKEFGWTSKMPPEDVERRCGGGRSAFGQGGTGRGKCDSRVLMGGGTRSCRAGSRYAMRRGR